MPCPIPSLPGDSGLVSAEEASGDIRAKCSFSRPLLPTRQPSHISRTHLVPEVVRSSHWKKKIAKNYLEVHIFVCIAAAFGNEIVLFLSLGNKRINSCLMEPRFSVVQ